MSAPKIILFLLILPVWALGMRRTFAVIAWLLGRRHMVPQPTPSAWWPTQMDLEAAGASIEIAALLAERRKIAAISMVRTETGVGLIEAKQAVDAMLIRARAQRVMDEGGSEQVAYLLARKNIARAVRAYRQETGAGRSQANEYLTALLKRAGA